MASTNTTTPASASATPSSTAGVSSFVEAASDTNFSDPQPTETGGPRGGGGGSGGDGGRVASSAALYLYTFLATLVLLLSVSAAIVVRSFILRRRHRRLVEEAIRNGTWVPPVPLQPGGGRALRVDLSKKPMMWEAYLGGNEKDGSDHGGYYISTSVHEEPRDWDAIKPISAAYLAPAVKPEQPAATKADADQTPTPVQDRSFGSRVQSFGVGMRSGFRWSVGLPPRPPSDDSANASHINLQAMGDGANASQSEEAKIPFSGPDGGPPVVRVSVIIAMPRPQKHSSSASSSSTSPVASSSTPSSSATRTLSPSNTHPLSPQQHQSHLLSQGPDPEEEEPLPVMEVGVAELVVVDHEAEERRNKLSAIIAKDPTGRDSASMTAEV